MTRITQAEIRAIPDKQVFTPPSASKATGIPVQTFYTAIGKKRLPVTRRPSLSGDKLYITFTGKTMKAWLLGTRVTEDRIQALEAELAELKASL